MNQEVDPHPADLRVQIRAPPSLTGEFFGGLGGLGSSGTEDFWQVAGMARLATDAMLIAPARRRSRRALGRPEPSGASRFASSRGFGRW